MGRWDAVRSAMREEKVAGWLVHDFRGSNPMLARLLPVAGGGKRWTTRRAVLWVPAEGEPELLVHAIDEGQFSGVDVRMRRYVSWRELHALLAERVGSGRRVAMEYSPGAALPAVSWVDAGTVDLVRGLGAEVVSSADLVQVSLARWSDEAARVHAEVSCKVAGIKDAAFGLIRERVRAGAEVSECEVQAFIMARFKEAGLDPQDPPIVAVNAHSGDPHFEPRADRDTAIRRGDWVLIDLWARRPGEEHIFSDITWVGCAVASQEDVPAKQREVFEVVKRARDAALARAQRGWAEQGEGGVRGFELDDAAREQIVRAGYEAYIKHRTGHSLSPGPVVHGMGMNLDNLETHDTRRMLAGTGFTIEPGVYLPEFGVRLEINVYVDPGKGPVVTSCVQDEIVLVG